MTLRYTKASSTPVNCRIASLIIPAYPANGKIVSPTLWSRHHGALSQWKTFRKSTLKSGLSETRTPRRSWYACFWCRHSLLSRDSCLNFYEWSHGYRGRSGRFEPLVMTLPRFTGVLRLCSVPIAVRCDSTSI